MKKSIKLSIALSLVITSALFPYYVNNHDSNSTRTSKYFPKAEYSDIL